MGNSMSTASPSLRWIPEDMSILDLSVDTEHSPWDSWDRLETLVEFEPREPPSSVSGHTSYPFSLAELIAYTRELTKARFGDRLANRLERLVDASREEYPRQEPLSPRSLQDFLFFIQSNQNVSYPSVVLTQGGNIRAEWHRARNRFFAAEFLGDGMVRYVLFAPDPSHPEKTARVSGAACYDSVMHLVQPHNVSNWVLEEEEQGR